MLGSYAFLVVPSTVPIVEDEKKMAMVLKKGFEADNHRVTLASDGHSGLEMAFTMEFDVV